MKALYKVTYTGTRKSHTYKTKKAALAQARWAIGIGNSRACVLKKLPSGAFQQVACLKRRRRSR